ncbi:MAG: XRE family transcriptional regulator [Burkholderiales bacterium RIFCSPLOWO2_12_FULL_61_40]|nr:MAG: XRE family transcriptional regulator [Burkholderiales bacterium RIFCSPLOWO2_12_FULL_61_40]
MQLTTPALIELARRLQHERKAQGLSREQAAAVCNVSVSFIRDAESNPGRCSLERLLQLTQGLGLTLALTGWGRDVDSDPHGDGISASKAHPA